MKETKESLAQQVVGFKNVLVWLLTGIDYLASNECEDPQDTAKQMLDALPKYDSSQHHLGCGPIELDEKAWTKPRVKHGNFPWMKR
jgi:hypothetical protein